MKNIFNNETEIMSKSWFESKICVNKNGEKIFFPRTTRKNHLKGYENGEKENCLGEILYFQRGKNVLSVMMNSGIKIWDRSRKKCFIVKHPFGNEAIFLIACKRLFLGLSFMRRRIEWNSLKTKSQFYHHFKVMKICL